MEIDKNTFNEEKPVYLIPERDRKMLINELYAEYGITELSDPLMLYQIEMGQEVLQKDAIISYTLDYGDQHID